MASPLFRGLRFYLTRTLSAEDKAELEQLIGYNGGEVSANPAGATQLVDYEKLDARHPEWVSTDFIKHSVAFRALQDPSQYTGKIFITEWEERDAKRRGRMKYTKEEQARMLHFAKLRGWKSMQTLPESAWRLAESERVTSHPAQSMHEHFRKQLQRKTPIEQRKIMAEAAAMTRAQLLEQKEEEEEEEEMLAVEPPSRTRASPNSTGLRRGATPESTTSTQTSRQNPLSAGRQSTTTPESSTIETQLEEVEEEKFSRRDRRTRSRKPTSPLRISQRLQISEGTESSEGITSPLPITASPGQSTPATPAGSATGDQSTGRKQQKRKRNTPRREGAVSQESSPSRQDTGGSDAESVGTNGDTGNGIFFRSVWTELAKDPNNRRMLQRFFEPPSARAPETQATSTESVASQPDGSVVSTSAHEGENSSDSRSGPQQKRTAEQATDEETDSLICQLQIDTQQDLPSVIHALYYCSGDVEMARFFLKGASPSGMWSPEDDLLLVNLVAEEGTNRPAIDAAVTRGDFASMQVPRDTDAILKRVEFLR